MIQCLKQDEARAALPVGGWNLLRCDAYFNIRLKSFIRNIKTKQNNNIKQILSEPGEPSLSGDAQTIWSLGCVSGSRMMGGFLRGWVIALHHTSLSLTEFEKMLFRAAVCHLPLRVKSCYQDLTVLIWLKALEVMVTALSFQDSNFWTRFPGYQVLSWSSFYRWHQYQLAYKSFPNHDCLINQLIKLISRLLGGLVMR